LADAFAGHAELLTHFFERVIDAIFKPVAQLMAALTE
jgi:hypothetical protein